MKSIRLLNYIKNITRNKKLKTYELKGKNTDQKPIDTKKNSTSFIFSVLLVLLLVGTSLGGNSALAQHHKLSDDAQVSLLTADPGFYLFETFGHSSLRISDPNVKLDLVYNYGAFDFFQENFYVNFLRGYMRYYLGVKNFNKVEINYLRRGIQVREQVLNLSQAEKQAVFEFLEENRKPENKYYYYDYFYDNCATKWRDILKEVLKEKLFFENPTPDSVYSIRQLMKRYTKKHAWGQFGIDLALGARIDKAVGHEEWVYIPEFLESAFEHASIEREGKKVPLVKSTQVRIEPTVKVEASKATFSPNEVAWIILAFFILFSILDWFRKKRSKWLDFFLFFSIGISGCILAFFWFFTNHLTASNNFNLIWAFPFHLVFAFLMFKKTPSAFVRNYALVNAGVTGLFLLGWGFLPQDINGALVPIVFLILIRFLLLYSEQNRLKKQARN